MKIYIDPKLGHDIAVCSKETADKLGKDYLGLQVNINEGMSPDVIAVNQRNYERLQKAPELPKKAPKEELKEEVVVEEVEDIKLSYGFLKSLKKKEQVHILLSFGIPNSEVRRLRREKDRIEAILMLQE